MKYAFAPVWLLASARLSASSSTGVVPAPAPSACPSGLVHVLNSSKVYDSYFWRYPQEAPTESDGCTIAEGGECWDPLAGKCIPEVDGDGDGDVAAVCSGPDDSWHAVWQCPNSGQKVYCEDVCATYRPAFLREGAARNCADGADEAEELCKTWLSICPGDSYLWRHPQEDHDEDHACSIAKGGECWDDTLQECLPATTTPSELTAVGDQLRNTANSSGDGELSRGNFHADVDESEKVLQDSRAIEAIFQVKSDQSGAAAAGVSAAVAVLMFVGTASIAGQ